LYPKLVEIGFFEPRDTLGEVWRQRSQPERTNVSGADGFVVHVTASLPKVEPFVIPPRRGSFPHRLEVRVSQTWRASQWAEPLKGRSAEDQGLANVGGMIREIAARATKLDTVKRDAFGL